MSMDITRGPEAAELGLLTPETTLQHATLVNNGFLRLEAVVRNTPLGAKFGPIYAEWREYYNKLRGNYFRRLVEFGGVKAWETRLNVLRVDAANAGLDVSAVPIIKDGKIYKEAPLVTTSKKGAGNVLPLLGIGAALAGLLWFINRR
jgi:hypothetical protein